MAEQRGLPVVRRTCSYSKEGVMCPVVCYKPFSNEAHLPWEFGGEEPQTGGHVL